MHPAKFMGRPVQSVAPPISEAERIERLNRLGAVIAGKRKDAVDARKSSGIEDVWMAAEEAYLGIDDMNRHEFANAKWAKPTTMAGGLTSTTQGSNDVRSKAYVRLTSRYVDHAAAKLGEILLPIDDKAFSFEPTPDPDLVKQSMDMTPLHGPDGSPVMMRAPQDPNAPQQTPIAQGAQQMVQMTAADQAKKQMDVASECAEKAETRIYDWMVESKYPAEARKVIHDAARIGTGVLKGPFPDIKESKALLRNGDTATLTIKQEVKPASRWIDVWNLFPNDACGENIHDGDELLERDYLSEKLLKRLKKQEGYLAEQIDAVIEEGPGKIYADGGNPNDKKNRKRYEIWYYYGTLKRDDMLLANAVGIDDLPEDQEEVYAIVSLVNDTVIRAIINPLDSGAFPYRVMTWSRRPGHWAGVGVAEQISMPQRTTNAATRSMLNNAGLSSGVQVVIDQMAIVPADGSYTLTPNKLWYKTSDANDIKAAFAVFTVPSMQEELMNIINYGMKLAEESSGIPLVTQGQSGPTDPQTFGQAELQDNNAHTWLRSVGYRYDDQITEPLVNDYYEWLLLDPSVPDDEKGDFQINAHGSIAMVERAIQEGVLLGLLKASENPAFEIDPAKLFAEYLKAKRLDPRKIQLSEEQKAERAKQQQPPPLPVMVEQVKGQNKLQQIQAEAQAELVVSQQTATHEHQLMQNGGLSPQMASAQAKVESEHIRAESMERREASRAHAEEARADKELLIAQQNGEYEIQKMQLQEKLAVIELAMQEKISIQEAQAKLAAAAMQEKTKRSMGAAEIELAASEGAQDRTHDMAKHATSLIRDQLSTPNTP